MTRAQESNDRIGALGHGDAPPARALATVAVCAAIAALLAASGAGPAAAADALTVAVSPAEAYLRPGQEVRFVASVTDARGRQVQADLAWSVIPARLGWIQSDGSLVAMDAEGRGIVRVVAQHGTASGSGHAVIDVGVRPPRRLSVVVTPAEAVAQPGGEVQFAAAATDPASGAPVSADLRWVVVPDALGTVTANGLFTAGASPGSGRVAARAVSGDREGVGDAGVVVGVPGDAALTVTVDPSTALLRPGDEVQFAASVTDAGGQPVETPVQWSVVPRALGAVSAAGVFTAGPHAMDGRVVATAMAADGPARGFAAIEVRRPGPAGVRVHVRPREAAVPPGGDVQFEAVVLGPDGEVVDVTVDWQARPAWIGSIAADGFFTAAEEFSEPASGGGWRGTVTASVTTTAGTASDAAGVFVRAEGQGARLRIVPPHPVVAPGQDIQFDTEMVGAGDPIGWTTEWAIFPPDLGTITPDGLFTANPVFGDPASPLFGPHEGAVGARATLDDGTTLSDLAHVLVRLQGVQVRVAVQPRFAVVRPGGSAQFGAVAYGPDGQPLDVPVRWSVLPPRIGTVTQDGLFTASSDPGDPGSWQRPQGSVVAEVVLGGGRVFRGAAVVVVDVPHPQVVVRISPREATLRPGQTQQFEATVVDQDGEPLALPVQWRVLNAGVGTIGSGGLFTATTAVLPGQTRETRVVASVEQGGQTYWDAAQARVTRGSGGAE
jgi:hypothetical protein